MFKVILKQTTLLVLTLLATTMATAQTVNMSRYITLTVQQGQRIQFRFLAAADGTGVKVKSGSNETEVTVGTAWTRPQDYTAGATTMTIYGDITGFSCGGNRAKLTAIDVSQNTALTALYCYDNQLTSLDVSQNTALTELRCQSNQLISLDVTQNTALTVLICYDNQLTALDVSQNTALTELYCYDNQLTALDVIHNTALTTLSCGVNQLTSLNVSQNTELEELYCYDNQLTALDVNQNTALIVLSCGSNQLTSLDVNQNTALIGLGCQENQLTTLDVTKNTVLTELSCSNNQLTSLNVTKNTALTGLECDDNQLTALDLSKNTALRELYCYGNPFTTQTFNDIMCSLPARTTADDAAFYPLYDASDAKYATFMAANSQIAKNKNWQVRYSDGSADIPATTGTYVCPTAGIAEVASVPLSVYPNPATDILTVETEATGAVITLADLTGRTVMTATATAGKTTLNISELSAGTYIVRVGDRVGKVVKR